MLSTLRGEQQEANFGFLLLLSIFQIFLLFLFIVYFYFLCKESSESNKEKIKANVWHRIAFILLSSPPFFGMVVAKHLGIIQTFGLRSTAFFYL